MKITPSTGASLSSVTGVLPVPNGGTNISSYTAGDTLYASGVAAFQKIAGNTTSTKKYWSQTGDASIPQPPVWSQPSAAELSDGTTGSGTVVLNTSPTLVTPVLGVAAATSMNFGETALSVYKEGTFTPAFTSLTVVLGAGSVAYTGKYTKIGNTVFWTILVQPSGGATTASLAGTTFINNLPYTIATPPGTCSAVNQGSLASYGDGAGGAASTNMFTPTWAATSSGVSLSGFFFV